MDCVYIVYAYTDVGEQGKTFKEGAQHRKTTSQHKISYLKQYMHHNKSNNRPHKLTKIDFPGTVSIPTSLAAGPIERKGRNERSAPNQNTHLWGSRDSSNRRWRKTRNAQVSHAFHRSRSLQNDLGILGYLPNYRTNNIYIYMCFKKLRRRTFFLNSSNKSNRSSSIQ